MCIIPQICYDGFNVKKIFLLFVAVVILVPIFAQARMVYPYPNYGYNQVDHICQVKQLSETSKVNDDLVGEFYSLRVCRSENPGIILFTGLGIILWFVLLSVIIVKNFYISPKLSKKKITTLEKRIGVLWESFLIAFSIFVYILLLHYFNVPRTFYDYGSDIDQIVYNVFIDKEIAMFYLVGYIVVTLGVIHKKK